MIFAALQSDLFRFKFHSLDKKIINPGIQPSHSLKLPFHEGSNLSQVTWLFDNVSKNDENWPVSHLENVSKVDLVIISGQLVNFFESFD